MLTLTKNELSFEVLPDVFVHANFAPPCTDLFRAPKRHGPSSSLEPGPGQQYFEKRISAQSSRDNRALHRRSVTGSTGPRLPLTSKAHPRACTKRRAAHPYSGDRDPPPVTPENATLLETSWKKTGAPTCRLPACPRFYSQPATDQHPAPPAAPFSSDQWRKSKLSRCIPQCHRGFPDFRPRAH